MSKCMCTCACVCMHVDILFHPFVTCCCVQAWANVCCVCVSIHVCRVTCPELRLYSHAESASPAGLRSAAALGSDRAVILWCCIEQGAKLTLLATTSSVALKYICRWPLSSSSNKRANDIL